jgi:DNA-directed RNA polymerase specialized sigma24 family protein
MSCFHRIAFTLHIDTMNWLQLNLDHNSPTQEAGRFRTTRWSVVLLSAQSQVPGSKTALAELCRLYWFPLSAFVRRRGYSPADTQDLVQGFFLHLLDHKALAEVDPHKGKCRSFLLASIKNHLSKETVRARSSKRRGKVEVVPLDTENAEEVCQFEPADFLTAETILTIFDARWVTALLHETMARLANQYTAQGKSAALQSLKPFLAPGGVQVVPSYEQAADQLQVSIVAVKTLIHRMRKQFTTLFCKEVARTMSDPAEIDAEIHSLCEALVASEGRLGP